MMSGAAWDKLSDCGQGGVEEAGKEATTKGGALVALAASQEADTLPP